MKPPVKKKDSIWHLLVIIILCAYLQPCIHRDRSCTPSYSSLKKGVAYILYKWLPRDTEHYGDLDLCHGTIEGWRLKEHPISPLCSSVVTTMQIFFQSCISEWLLVFQESNGAAVLKYLKGTHNTWPHLKKAIEHCKKLAFQQALMWEIW